MRRMNSSWISAFAKLGFKNRARSSHLSGHRCSLGYYTRRLAVEPLEDRYMLAITVSTLTDEADGSIIDGDISLRDAIDLAPAGSVIDFAPSLFTPAGSQTLLLTLNELTINKSLTITGPGASELIIDASGNDSMPDEDDGGGSRIFNIDDGNGIPDRLVSITGLTLTGGDAAGSGGGILNAEHLTLSNSIVSGNTTLMSGGGLANYFGSLLINGTSILGDHASFGGGIYSYGGEGVTLADSIISGNLSSGSAGGILYFGRILAFQTPGPGMSIMRTTFADNNASNWGGGLYSVTGREDVTILDSTISGNSAGPRGGGVYAGSTLGGDLRIENSTVSYNSSDQGGGLFLADSGILNNLTITRNRAINGAGLFAAQQVQLTNSIVSGNTDPGGDMPNNISGTLALASSYNLVGTNGAGGLAPSHGNILNINDPQLGPLQNNGGPTRTHSLDARSRAINAGDLTDLYSPDEFDQRGNGFARVLHGRIDIGAIESQSPPLSQAIPRLRGVDLSVLVPNLEFEGALMLPNSYGDMMVSGQTVEAWSQLTEGTTDYFHVSGFMGTTGSGASGVAPVPTNGSQGFIGVFNLEVHPQTSMEYQEYAINVLPAPLESGVTYQLDLFAGAAGPGGQYGGAFNGELVIYGILDASLIPLYQNELGPIEQFAGTNVVELLSISVNQAVSTWASLPDQVFSPDMPIEAIVFGSRSESSQSYLLIDALQSTPPPQVTDVRLSGSGWDTTPGRTPISFRTDSLVGGLLTGTGSQLKPVPIQGIDTIEIEFGEGVTVADDDLVVLTQLGTPVSHVDFGYDSVTNIATWTLAAPLSNGKYTLLLNQGSTVTDLTGVVLDGEWDNPTSTSDASSNTFSSGNGIPGGEFHFNLSVLVGDYNRNGVVDAADYSVWRDNLGQTIAAADGNGDGLINADDYGVWKSHFGESLPSGGGASLAVTGGSGSETDIDGHDVSLAVVDQSRASIAAVMSRESPILPIRPYDRRFADKLWMRAVDDSFADLDLIQTVRRDSYDTRSSFVDVFELEIESRELDPLADWDLGLGTKLRDRVYA